MLQLLAVVNRLTHRPKRLAWHHILIIVLATKRLGNRRVIDACFLTIFQCIVGEVLLPFVSG